MVMFQLAILATLYGIYRKMDEFKANKEEKK